MITDSAVENCNYSRMQHTHTLTPILDLRGTKATLRGVPSDTLWTSSPLPSSPHLSSPRTP